MSLFRGYKTEYYNNGDKYVGFFKDGKRHGEGSYYYVNGNQFDGNWVNGIKNGAGVMRYNDGTIFTGDWKDGLRHGVGVAEKPNGDTIIRCIYKNNKLFNILLNESEKLMYVGQLLDDFYHGIGILNTPKETYMGEWNEGDLDGFGTLSCEGLIYYGHFADDTFNGLGTLCYQNGEGYHGQFKDGKLNGFGFMKYNDGSFYIGYWKDNVRHGCGLFKTNEYTYHGDFVNDKYQGEGFLLYERGKFYIGEFKNGYADGYGSFFVNDKPINTGIWSNWKFIESKEISLDNYIKNLANKSFKPIYLKDNSQYIGVDNNSINGYGIYLLEDGSFTLAKWIDGKPTNWHIVLNLTDNFIYYRCDNDSMLVPTEKEELIIEKHNLNDTIIKKTILSSSDRIEIQTRLDDNTINYKIYSDEKNNYLEFNTLDDVFHGKYLCFDTKEYTLIEEEYYRGSKE